MRAGCFSHLCVFSPVIVRTADFSLLTHWHITRHKNIKGGVVINSFLLSPFLQAVMGFPLHWNIFFISIIIFLSKEESGRHLRISRHEMLQKCFHIGMMSTLLEASGGGVHSYIQCEGGNILYVPSRGMSTFSFFHGK